jgi:hypothetical protein
MKRAAKKKTEKPRIKKISKIGGGKKPNTCRACAGSKFC